MRIANPDLSKELQDAGRFQLNQGILPTELADKIIPVIEINPKLLRRCTYIQTNGGSAGSVTIATTPIDRDVYITAAWISVSKLVTDSNTHSQLKVTPKGGASTTIVGIAGTTLNAETGSIAISFPVPIILERGTVIQLAKVSANGTAIAGVTGYTVENYRS
jgi:hypothetical protein